MTATLAAAPEQAVLVGCALVVVPVGLGFTFPEIAMSAQVRYTWPVWKEFQRRERRVWAEL